MELHEAMLKRRSIRKYTKEKVSKEDIETLLKYAMSGPSACNRCPWEFYVISNEEVIKEFYTSFRPMRIEAPLAIVVCGNMNETLKDDLSSYWIQDCSAAVENILLGAVSLNLGTVWCGITPQADKVQKTKEILSLDDHIIPLGLVYVGHPDIEQEPRTQYKEEKVHYIE